MPEPDCFLRYNRIGYETLQPCLGCYRAALLRVILRRENPTYRLRIGGTPLERAVILKRFYSQRLVGLLTYHI